MRIVNQNLISLSLLHTEPVHKISSGSVVRFAEEYHNLRVTQPSESGNSQSTWWGSGWGRRDELGRTRRFWKRVGSFEDEPTSCFSFRGALCCPGGTYRVEMILMIESAPGGTFGQSRMFTSVVIVAHQIPQINFHVRARWSIIPLQLMRVLLPCQLPCLLRRLTKEKAVVRARSVSS